MAISKQKFQSNFDAALFGLSLDRSDPQPLHSQLTRALRDLLRGPAGQAGLRLPASRMLAAELSVSRMTVTTAYDQLLAEGYLVARRGAGTYVAEDLPHLAPPPASKSVMSDTVPAEGWRPFQPGLPDQVLFPHRLWARHLEAAWRSPAPALLGRNDPFGWLPLRSAIAAHLAAWRGLDCDPAQIIVTSGARDAFQIIAALMDRPDPHMVIEDPGWPAMRAALAGGGIQPVPRRIDDEGLAPECFPDGAAGAVVTPARHYPTGRVMPLPRRLALLDWARQAGALVIEDDYDSEFRYQGQPLPSLSGLDGLQHTSYLGSFSKLFSPALRIGYLVLPARLLSAARGYLALAGSRASLVPQPALARFMESGDFATHLRRMRRIYARRQAHLLAELAPAGDLLELRPDPAGMHLCLPLTDRLRQRSDDCALVRAAGAQGLKLGALSAHAVLPDPPQGLLLGYAGFDEAALSMAARDLIALL